VRQRIIVSAGVCLFIVFVMSSVFAAANSTENEKADSAVTATVNRFLKTAPDMSFYRFNFKALNGIIQSGVKSFILIDVRDEQAFGAEHIPEAINVPLPLLVDKLSLLPKDKPVYVIANQEGDSAYATAVLRMLDYHAWLIEGGEDAWKTAGYPLETKK
jgi:rhodanese-related sulfurtransferase